MSDNRVRASAWVLAAVGFLLLGACGGDDDDGPTEDDDRESGADAADGDDGQAANVARLEDDIAVNLAEDVNQPTPEVDCPDDIEPSEGEQVECTGTAQDGEQFTIEVTWLDDEGRADAYVPPEQFG